MNLNTSTQPERCQYLLTQETIYHNNAHAYKHFRTLSFSVTYIHFLKQAGVWFFFHAAVYYAE